MEFTGESWALSALIHPMEPHVEIANLPYQHVPSKSLKPCLFFYVKRNKIALKSF